MNIIINEIERPKCNSFTMFAKPNLGLLAETKEIEIHVNNKTKTRLSTSMYFGGNYSAKINIPFAGFKTHEEQETNYFSGGVSVSHYFVKSKKQNKDSYKEYLKLIIEVVIKDYFKLDIDTLTVNVYFSNTFI
jgi:hypothetical protein